MVVSLIYLGRISMVIDKMRSEPCCSCLLFPVPVHPSFCSFYLSTLPHLVFLSIAPCHSSLCLSFVPFHMLRTSVILKIKEIEVEE